MLSSDVGGKLDYSPVSWREYFDQMEDVNVGPADSMDIFRIYKAGSDGPLLVLLHGGGHSALSWAVFTVSIKTAQSINEGDQIILIFFCFRQPFPVEWPAEYSQWISGVMVSGHMINTLVPANCVHDISQNFKICLSLKVIDQKKHECRSKAFFWWKNKNFTLRSLSI